MSTVRYLSPLSLATFLRCVLLFLVAVISASAAEPDSLVLNTNRIRLGSLGRPEWDSFTNDPASARRLDLEFNASSNLQPVTLFIRQDDVRQDWPVELNGRRLGKLFPMEADLIHQLTVPSGALRDGSNTLSILPPNNDDDIVLHEVRLDPLPALEAIGQSTLTMTVMDETGAAIPSRLTIVDAHGTLAPIVGLTNQESRLAVRPGVVYTGTGVARIGLPDGRYTVYASRGFEWSVATQSVRTVRGEESATKLILRREVSTPGWVSCDTHVHTFTHSRHGDATVEERLLTLAGEGIELPIATDHNLAIDYRETARRIGVDRAFTPVVGNEVTTPAGHFNLFPVSPEARVPDFKLTDWPRLMSAMRDTPGPVPRVVVLNHPRNVHSGFQPFAATNFNAVSGDNYRGPEFTFDAMELMNSSAQQSDYQLVVRDWLALLNHGYRVTTVGSSDSHDVSRYIVGQGRTYVACPDSDPARLDVATACSNLVAGRALVSMGLLVQLTVEDEYGSGDVGKKLPKIFRVQARVLGPSWVQATNVVLWMNGTVVRDQTIDRAVSGERGVQATINWTIPRPAHDAYVVAVATGPGVTAPYWAIPKPYQPVSRQWHGRVFAATNPIWLDADGDGRFTSARGYAGELVKRYGRRPRAFLRALDRFDEATAAQAASLCKAGGVDVQSESFRGELAKSSDAVRRGFEAFGAAERAGGRDTGAERSAAADASDSPR